MGDVRATYYRIFLGSFAFLVVSLVSAIPSTAQQASESIPTPTSTPSNTPTWTPIPVQVNLTVQASPPEWGVPTGSGTYNAGSTVSAGITANYGYEFTKWQDTSGQDNPRSVIMNAATTLVGLLDRRRFAVTLYLGTWSGGNSNFGTYTFVQGKIYNASTGLPVGTDSVSVTNPGRPVSQGKYLTVYVPYGDVVYFDGYATAWGKHMTTLWTGNNRHDQEWGWAWYTKSVSNISRVQVLGDTNLGEFQGGTPLMIDLSGEGKPDLLAGREWRKMKSRRPSTDLGVYRSFDLDGTGKKEWEWIGKGDGLLIYTAGLKGTPTYKELFGTRTFDNPWKHGYEALATLDTDANGVLKEDELKDIGVWVDANSDAVAQPGEIRSAKDAGLTQLSVRFEADPDGNVSNSRGANVGGRDVAVWDWISYAFPKTTPENEVARLDWTNKPPATEYFKVEAQQGMKVITMLPGGTLRVYRIHERLYVRATAKLEEKGDKVLDALYPAEVTSEGLLRWGMEGLTNTLMASGPDLYGITQVGDNQYGLWSAKLASGNLAALFDKR